MKVQSSKVKSPETQPQSQAWSPFADKLAAVLSVLEEDQFLVVAAKRSNRFVQFAAQGSFGMRAETASNNFLARADRLNDKQIVMLGDIGWTSPTGSPEESIPENQPDGSPNFFAEFSVPVQYSAIAQMAVRTLAEVLRVPHPGFLAYEAFDKDGKAILLPTLGLKHADPMPTQKSETDPNLQLQMAIRECIGLRDINIDGSGDILLRYGSVAILLQLMEQSRYLRMLSALVSDIRETAELFSRLNEINTNLGPMHLFLQDGNILAVACIATSPFVAEHVIQGIEDFCQIADGMDSLLQAEFGGTTAYTDSLPSSLKH